MVHALVLIRCWRGFRGFGDAENARSVPTVKNNIIEVITVVNLATIVVRT